MKKFILVMMMILGGMMSIIAQDMNELSLTMQDTTVAFDDLAADTIDPMQAEQDSMLRAQQQDPEWYVAPIPYDSVMRARRAPRRAAAGCQIDSVQTFDEAGVLVAVTMYEYGDTTRTMTWAINPDGSRIGQSWHEEANTANSTYTADYEWDNASGSWAGASREENIFNSANKNISRTIYTWINHAWVPNTRYQYDYDSSNREIEFTTFTRNASTNELVYSKQRLREYNSAGKLTQEINYTAYSNGAWSAGNKTINAYDAKGNITEKTYYSTYTGGVWGGTASTHELWEFRPNTSTKTSYVKQTWSNAGWINFSKEIWEFNGPSSKQTLHEQYTWSNEDWAITVSDTLGYDALGNKVLDAKYTITNGVWKGKSKTQYTFSGTTSTGNITYKWVAAKGAFDPNVWTVSNNHLGDTIENCKYSWKNDAWVGNGNRTLSYTAGNKTDLITQTWSTQNANWINSSLKTTIKSGGKTIEESTFIWYAEGLQWVGLSRSDWHYNAAGLNDTIKTYLNNGTEWIYSKRTIKTYSGSTVIMTHISNWNVSESRWVLASMTKTDIVDKTIEGIRQTLNASWQCGADSIWVGIQKDSSVYSATGKLLTSISYNAWANNDWVPSGKLEYQYDIADRKTVEQTFDWKNNAWVGKIRNEYHFDEQGREYITASYVGWDNAINDWKGSTKTERTFYPNNLEATSILYGWNANSSSWVYSIRYSYTYDNSARETEQIVEYYNSGSWKNREKYIKEYRGNLLVKDNAYTWLNNQWTFWLRNESYYDEDSQAKLRREIIGSWSNGVVSSYTDNRYHYDCDHPYYTIRFENYNGTLLQSKEVKETKMPKFTGATPTKPATAQYTYTFKGWTPAITAVTGHATYTAEFDSVLNTYTIAFVNYDGTSLQSGPWAYGAMPEYTGETPTKPATAEYTFNFIGWDKEIGLVTDNETYTATFDSVAGTYQITWLNADGTLIDQTVVALGVVPTHEDATKAATAQYTYTFAGWTPEIVAVAGNATYTAKFDSIVNKYTITWLNDDDTEIDHALIEYGVVPTHADAEKTNTAEWTYAFTGWDKEVVAVTGDATYKATFSSTKNSYTITWLNADNSPIDQNTLEYGATPTHADAEKTNTAEWSYSFIGWSPEIASVTGNAVYTAQFDSVRNSYTITWRNADGLELSHETLEYGAMPTHADPMKPANAQYTYTFAGWTPAIESVTGNAVYTAQFDSVVNTYTVIFYDEDGTTELDRATVAYGNTPQYTGSTPNKPATAEYTYTFSGWSPEVITVTGDANYTAVYSATTNEYTVTFQNGDEVLQSNVIAYGLTPSYNGNDPIKIANAEWSYTFAGWSPEIASVTGEATYTARFDSVRNSYTVIWLSDDGSELDRATLEYGTMPQYTGGTPNKPATAEYTFNFIGWDKEITLVTGNETYTARFDSVVNTYTVIFYYEDGYTELDRHTYTYGEMPATAYVPSLPGTPQYTYVFAGWIPAIEPVTGDAAYVAVFDTVMNRYTVTFVNYNGVVLQRSQVDYGTLPVYEGTEPEKPANAQYHYVFSGWSPQLATVTRDATYTAQFTSELNTFVVIFYDEDGVTELDRVEVAYGKVPTTTVIPTKAEDEEYTYTFAGWSPRIVAATSDASYVATYTATPKHNGLDDVESAAPAKKIFRNGQIYILRAGKVYSADGVLVE